MKAGFGQFLVFHLKYWPEMKQLDDQEDAPKGLEDPDETKRMAREVGDQSKKEAAELLEKCGAEIRKHFEEVGDCRPIEKRSAIESKWSISFEIKLKDKFWTRKARLSARLEIKGESNELIAWLWRRANKESEATMAHLKSKAPEGAVVVSDEEIMLGKRLIYSPDQDGFVLDDKPVIKFVREAYAGIKAHDLELVFPK